MKNSLDLISAISVSVRLSFSSAGAGAETVLEEASTIVRQFPPVGSCPAIISGGLHGSEVHDASRVTRKRARTYFEIVNPIVFFMSVFVFNRGLIWSLFPKPRPHRSRLEVLLRYFSGSPGM